MSYEIYFPQTFQRCIKHLKKKFPRIKDDLFTLFHNLQNDPRIGDPIPGWNRKVWKIRIPSRDLKRGKSGAFRIIYAWTSGERIVNPLFVYFKGEKEDITKAKRKKPCFRCPALSASLLESEPADVEPATP